MIGGRYRLHALLGEGGMARVFDSFDERLERPVAVKILRPETEALPGMRKRFQQEARISARLVHPNIVAVLDYGEDGPASYLVMERLPGRTLRDEMARGPMPPERLDRAHDRHAGRLGRRPQVRRAPPRHQTEQHPARRRRPRPHHRLRDREELRRHGRVRCDLAT